MKSFSNRFLSKIDHRNQIDEPLISLVSPFVNAEFYQYISNYHAESEFELPQHYVEVGLKLGLDPNPYFSGIAYLDQYPDVASANYTPFLHYINHGMKEGRDVFLSGWGKLEFRKAKFEEVTETKRYFQREHYVRQAKDLEKFDDDALVAHFLTVGILAGLEPCPKFFDAISKGEPRDIKIEEILGALQKNEILDRRLTKRSSNLQSREDGQKTADEIGPKDITDHQRNELDLIRSEFDFDFYRSQKTSFEGNDEDLLLDFYQIGWKEGYDPNPNFSTRFYLESNQDIASANINPFVHFLVFGKTEGRRPKFEKVHKLITDKNSTALPKNMQNLFLASSKQVSNRRATKAWPNCLSIHWIVPDFSKGGGGHMTIFRMIRYLENFGHNCTVWIDSPKQHSNEADAYDDIVKYFQCVSANVRFIDDSFGSIGGDVLIATSWETAYTAAKNTNFSERFYFVQDFEPSFYAMGAEYLLAENTYRLGLSCICASPWLKEKMESQYGCWSREFYLAYDHEIYNLEDRDDRKDSKKFKIALYSRKATPRRCVILAMAALELLSKERDDFEVHFFGAQKLGLTATPYEAYDHGVLAPDELASLYRECDIGICFSGTNYSLVPQEMMACGLPVMELEGESTLRIFPNGVVSFVKPDPNGIAINLSKFIERPEKLDHQRQSAFEWVEQFSWEESARKVESAILEKLNQRNQLKKPKVINAKQIQLDVVIPTFNGIGEIEAVIGSLRQQKSFEQIQIYCVDSSSSDGTNEWLKKQKDISVTTIVQSEFQHGKTRNLGASLGKSDFIAFLTQDAVPATSSWTVDILKMFSHYSDAAGLFGRHIAYPNHSIFTKYQISRMFDNFLKFPLAISKQTDLDRWNSGDQEWRQFLHFYSDNNSAMRRQVWNEIPYANIDYGEDQVWANDLINKGYQKLYAPTVAVFHSHDYDEKQTYERARTEAEFFKEHFGYVLCDLQQDQLDQIVWKETRQIEGWGRAHGANEQEILQEIKNVSAKYHGWLQGSQDQTKTVN